MSRPKSREAAIKIVYQNGFLESDLQKVLDTYYMACEEDELKNLEKEFIKDIVFGVNEHMQELDALINEFSKEWTLDRMSRVDIAVLRVAIYEMLYRPDIHPSVSINEAVEFAKKYSYEDAGSFVNGILGGIYSAKCC